MRRRIPSLIKYKGDYLMFLEEKTYRMKELAEWFEIQPKTFSDRKQEKLEELSQYAEFQVNYSQTGRILSIEITKVKEPVYGVLSLKNQFLKWLPANLHNIAEETEEWGSIISWPLVVNCYCQENNIDYDGAHYVWVSDAGRSDDGKRKVMGYHRVPNSDFKIWHYLLHLAKAWGQKNHIALEDYGIDCCADSFNPTHLRLTTEEDKEVREKIYSKWFGIKHQEVLDLVDYIEYYDDDYINKEDLMQLKLCQRLSDKEKRKAAAEECVQAGVLRRKGYVLNDCGEPVEESLP